MNCSFSQLKQQEREGGLYLGEGAYNQKECCYQTDGPLSRGAYKWDLMVFINQLLN